MAKISNKKSKERLIKVLHVLYPEYKHVTVKNDLSIQWSRHTNWFVRFFSRKYTVSYELLKFFKLPRKLAQLKYDNTDFLGEVIKEITSTEMRKEDVVMYFFKEIVVIKYPHVFKDYDLESEMARYSDEDFDCIEEKGDEYIITMQKAKEQVNKETKGTFLLNLQCHPMYYEIVTMTALATMLITYILWQIFK